MDSPASEPPLASGDQDIFIQKFPYFEAIFLIEDILEHSLVINGYILKTLVPRTKFFKLISYLYLISKQSYHFCAEPQCAAAACPICSFQAQITSLQGATQCPSLAFTRSLGWKCMLALTSCRYSSSFCVQTTVTNYSSQDSCWKLGKVIETASTELPQAYMVNPPVHHKLTFLFLQIGFTYRLSATIDAFYWRRKKV